MQNLIGYQSNMRQSNNNTQLEQVEALHFRLANAYILFFKKHLPETLKTKKIIIDAIDENGLISTQEMTDEIINQYFPFLIEPKKFNLYDRLDNKKTQSKDLPRITGQYINILILLATQSSISQTTIIILNKIKEKTIENINNRKKNINNEIPDITLNAILINFSELKINEQLKLKVINTSNAPYSFFQINDENLPNLIAYLDAISSTHQKLIINVFDSLSTETLPIFSKMLSEIGEILRSNNEKSALVLLNTLKKITSDNTLFQSSEKLSPHRINLTINYLMELTLSLFEDHDQKNTVCEKIAALRSTLLTNPASFTLIQQIEKWIRTIEAKAVTTYGDLNFLMDNPRAGTEELVAHKLRIQTENSKEHAKNAAGFAISTTWSAFGFAAEQTKNAGAFVVQTTGPTINTIAQTTSNAASAVAEKIAESSTPLLNKALGGM